MSVGSLIGRAVVAVAGVLSIKSAHAPGHDESPGESLDDRRETDHEDKATGYDHGEHDHDGYTDGHCSYDGGQ